MQENYNPGRTFVILSGEQRTPKTIQVMNDIKVGRYGVIADDMERNPTAKQMRFMQKTEVVQTVLTMFGNVGVPPQAISLILQWWLSESDLGDIDKFIQAFAGVIREQQEGQADEAQKMNAMQQVQGMLDLAAKKQSLEAPGLSAGGGPGERKAVDNKK